MLLVLLYFCPWVFSNLSDFLQGPNRQNLRSHSHSRSLAFNSSQIPSFSSCWFVTSVSHGYYHNDAHIQQKNVLVNNKKHNRCDSQIIKNGTQLRHFSHHFMSNCWVGWKPLQIKVTISSSLHWPPSSLIIPTRLWDDDSEMCLRWATESDMHQSGPNLI